MERVTVFGYLKGEEL